MLMFTGIIEETGVVKEIQKRRDNLRLIIGADKIMEGLKLGDSIAVDGICISVVAINKRTFEADISKETVKKTTVMEFMAGKMVNLESAVRIGGHLGGHIVTGHVDGVGRIKKFERKVNGSYLTITMSADLRRYMIPRGSVAVDGISLTIAELNHDSIIIALIPHTLKMTSLEHKNAGDGVNIECDIIGKYVERLVGSTLNIKYSKIDTEFLKNHGYSH